MKIDYTELEREKLARIEAQLGLLQSQGNMLVTERQMLMNSILERGDVNEEFYDKAVFKMDHVEIADE